jgi:membrane-associated protease RseP (regulator of RpoE activity)
MFCPNCGKEIKPDDLFCTSCGTKLDFLQQVAQEQPDLLEEAPLETPEQETQPVQQEPDDQNEYQEDYPEEYSDEYQDESQDNYQDEGYYQEDYQDYTAPPRKRLPIWALILIIVGGVLVTAAMEDSELQAGDVLLRINGEEIKDIHDLRTKLYGMNAGDPVELQVLRSGEQTTVSTELR